METMKRVESIEQALKLFEEYSTKRGKALYSGDSKTANRCYDNIRKIVHILRDEKQLDRLAIFYNHPNTFVKSAAATYLLPVHEKESIKVLKEISKMKVFGSLDAEIIIKEWKNGNLRDFYTL